MTSNQHYMTVQGTLTADPELKYLQGGTAAVSFSLAFNPRTYNKEAGAWQDGTPTYFDCAAYGKLAEGIAAHPDLRRGKRALGYGRISTRTWEDKNGGGTRSRDETILDSFGPDVTWYADDQNRDGGGPQQGGGYGGPQQGGGTGGPAAADPWAAAQPQQGGGYGGPQQGGGQWGQNPNGGWQG